MLPTGKAIEIAWKSIRVRIWRSLITTSGIVLAIAFLTSIWVTGAITGALQNVSEDDENYGVITRLLQKRAIAQENVSIRVGIIGGGGAREGPSRNTPAVLVRDVLQERQEFAPFLVPTSLSAFEGAVEPEDPAERPDALLVTSFPSSLAHSRVVAALARFVQTGGMLVVFGYEQLWPEETDEPITSEFEGLLPGRPGSGTLEARGNSIEPSGHPGMADVKWAEHPDDLAYIRVEPREGAEELARVAGEGILWTGPYGEGTVFWYPVAGDQALEPAALHWFLKGRVLVDSLRWGAREKLRGGTMAMRNLWLVSLSLMVCIVGITNAMLMSVTERFREIGTMKCLGALDSFVVRLFLIESSFQGAAGSLLGATLGLTLAFARALFAYHFADVTTGESYWFALQYFPGVQILFWILVAIVIGTVLSVLAAVYPAYRAAKMEPVEAMRTEA